MGDRFDFSKKSNGWDQSEGTPDWAMKGNNSSYNASTPTGYGKQISPYDSYTQQYNSSGMGMGNRAADTIGGNTGTGMLSNKEKKIKFPKDTRPLMERLFHPPPPAPDAPVRDYLEDERPIHQCCGVYLPQMPPKFYDETHIPTPNFTSDIKYLIPPNQQSMWSGSVKQSEKGTFPPLITTPSLFAGIAICTVIALLILLEIGPLYNLIHDKFPNKATHTYIIQLASIPIVSVVFTYCHIWLALWLTFYPIEFVGIGRIPGTNVGNPGWQGIIPFKAERMARISVRLISGKLIDPKTMFSRINPIQVSEAMGPLLRRTMADVLEAVARQNSPEVWALLPQRVKDELAEKAAEDAPEIVQAMFAEMRERIDDVFDLEAMTVKFLTSDKQQLVNMFIACGYTEIKFIRNTGATMGFIFGTLQMIIWIFYQGIWYNPIYGGIVGTITNYLALQMIFRPVEPTKYCGITFQGLFLTRQKVVAAQYANLVAQNILTARNMVDSMVAGPTADAMFDLVHRHVRVAVDNFSGPGKPVVEMAMGQQALDRIRRDFGNRMVQLLPEMMSAAEGYMENALNLETTLREKMEGLSSTDFEQLLHPVFQQDEWKLVAMGGALGVIIGTIQIFILTA